MRPGRVVAASAALAGVALVLGLGVEFRTSRSELAPEDDPEQRRMKTLIEEVGGGSVLIACVEPSGDPSESTEEIRELADELAAELERDPLVRKVYYRVPVDWFLERSLYLMDPERLHELAGVAPRGREALRMVAEARSFTELNERLAAGLEQRLDAATATPEQPEGGPDLLVALFEAQRGFAEDPDEFVDALDAQPPLLALAPAPGLSARGYLSSRDGTKVFLIVSPGTEDDALPTLRRFIASMRARIDAVTAAHPGFRVALTGEPAMVVEEMDTIRRDTWFTSVVAVAGVTLLTLFVFRWRTHAFLVLAVLAMGILWAFGAVRLEYGYLNLVTSSFLSTLVGVGVAYLIHPVSEYELEGAHTGDPAWAAREAYHRTGAPVTVAAVTTSAAFFSILLMKFRGFAELGLVAGVGVVLCLIAALVTMPAMLVLYGRRRHRKDRAARRGPASAAVDRFWVERGAAYVCRYPRTVSVAALAITALMAWNARGIGFNTNLLDLLPRNSEALEYQRKLIEESDFSPISNMAVAESLDELERMRVAAEAEPSIRRFESVLQFLPEDPDAVREAARIVGTMFAGLNPPERAVDLDRETFAASLRRIHDALERAAESAFGAGLGDVAAGLDDARAAAGAAADAVAGAPAGMETRWNEAQGRLRDWAGRLLDDLRRAAAAEPPSVGDLPRGIRDRFVTRSGQFVAYLQPHGDVFDPEVLSEYVAASRRIAPQVTGFPVVYQHVSGEITSGFYRAIVVGAALVLLILLVDYRKMTDAALSVVPLAMGVVWMAGSMGLLGLDFNFANLVAVPLIIGVGIDNGVHVMHRVRLEGRSGMTVVLRHTGRAILIASLTTMIGFGSLGLASHQGLASLGKVLLLGVGSCLATSMFVLPNLLVVLGRAHR